MLLLLKRSLTLTALFFTFFSCTEEKEKSIVLTENVLYLSAERIRLSGRIYSLKSNKVSEHGFEIGETETFENPIIIENGPRNSLGVFIGETSELVSEKSYYYRAFVVIDGEILYGKTKPFKSLKVSIKSFEPHVAYSGDEMTIVGANFPSDVKIFFGEVEAKIINIDLEAIITVEIPEIGEETLVPVNIIGKNTDLTFEEPFEYIFGIWNELAPFSISSRFLDPISISKTGKFITGLGLNVKGPIITINNEIWEYDINSRDWMEVSYTGKPSLGAFYNDEGYFGSGVVGFKNDFAQSPIPGFEFWKYDNGTINYIGELPFATNKAISFFYEGSVYVTGGLKVDGSSGQNFNLYKYSEQTDTWIDLGIVPIEVSQELPYFTFENSQYFITKNSEIWSYNMLSGEWNNIDKAPFTISTRNGISRVIGNRVYIGIFTFDNKLWEYNITSNTWKIKSQINEDRRSYKNAGSFINGSRVGVVRLNPNLDDSNWIKTWEFEPLAF